MLGAIAGDMIGSVYEFENHRSKNFPLFITATTFTDDTILSVAVADVLLNSGDYAQAFKKYYRRYPNPAGSYGARFHQWAAAPTVAPYNSWGNGSAMRVSPVGFAGNSLASVLTEAEKTAAVTHNHPEGIKGAQATAAAIFLARHGRANDDIRNFVMEQVGYN